MAGPTRSTPQPRQPEYAKVQPPRPRNAWILYRSDQFQSMRHQSNERISQAEVSRLISQMWKNEQESVRRHYEQMAEQEKLKHQEQYPDYRFCPQKREDKLRNKEEQKQKQSRRPQKSRTAPMSPDADATASSDVVPPLPAMPQPYSIPGYPPNAIMPQPYLYPHPFDVHYGHRGPTPPISAAPSPAPCESSRSPKPLPSSDGNVASSSSSPSVRSSTSFGSRASSSSSQLPANQAYIPSLPSSHHPSPNPYATQSLPALLFQSSAPSELPMNSSQSQRSSPENMAATMWDNMYAQLPSQNSEVVKFDVAIDQPQNTTELQQEFSDSPSLESMLSSTNENGVFSLSSIDTSNLVAQPPGELEVGMGAQAPTLDYNGQLFADIDFIEFQRQLDSLTEAGPSYSQVAPSVEEFASLFHPPNNPEAEAYAATQQRQPSAFTQDMMSFFNFEAAEGSTDDTSSAVSPVPVATAIAPQQVRSQNTQHSTATPIFTQMTNMATTTVTSGSSYVPPAGAIYSSTRRVAGSWKPTFTVFPRMEDPVQSWTLSTN